MSLPTINLYVGLFGDVTLIGPGGPTFLFSDWTEARLVCEALGIVKSTADAAQAAHQNGGADLLVHFLDTDTLPADPAPAKSPGAYPYQVQVRDATANEWRDVAGIGSIVVQAQA